MITEDLPLLPVTPNHKKHYTVVVVIVVVVTRTPRGPWRLLHYNGLPVIGNVSEALLLKFACTRKSRCFFFSIRPRAPPALRFCRLDPSILVMNTVQYNSTIGSTKAAFITHQGNDFDYTMLSIVSAGSSSRSHPPLNPPLLGRGRIKWRQES